MTRTFTVYWNEDDVRSLEKELARLEEDFGERRAYMSGRTITASRQRLDLLRAAIALLTEEVPE